MSRYPVRHACDGLDLEDGLRLSAEGDCRLKWVLNSMIAQKLEEIRRVLINDDFAIGDVDSEPVREKLFLILEIKSALGFDANSDRTPYSCKQSVEQQREVLLRGIGQGDLDHICHLVAIAVQKPGLERASGARSREGHILLHLCPLQLLALLALRRGRYDGRHVVGNWSVMLGNAESRLKNFVAAPSRNNQWWGSRGGKITENLGGVVKMLINAFCANNYATTNGVNLIACLTPTP